VFLLGDAVTTGIVGNLSRPGGNLTGVSFLNDELSSKRLELLRDVMPSLQSVAVFHDPNTTRKFLEVTEDTGRRLGLKLQVFALTGVDTFEQAFAAVAAERLEAVDVLSSAFFNANRDRFAELALKYRLPATYADKIIKGAKPGDLPVEQPTKFEMLVNLKTAKAIGLKLSDSFLLRADEVIE